MIRCSSSTIGRWRRFFPLVRVWSSPPWVMRHLKRKSAALNPKSYALGTSGSGIPLALAAAHTARHQAPTRRLAAASTSLDAGARKAIARPVWHNESGRTSKSTAFNIKPKPGKRWANTSPPDAGRASRRVPRGGLGRLIGSSAASRSGQGVTGGMRQRGKSSAGGPPGLSLNGTSGVWTTKAEVYVDRISATCSFSCSS